MISSEVEDEGVLLARIGAVEAAQRLHGLDVAQFLVNHHGMEQRLIKAGLVFLGDHEDVALFMEHRLGLALGDAVALRVAVHAALGILGSLRVGGVLDCAGEGYHHGNVIVPLRLEVVVDGAAVAHRSQTMSAPSFRQTSLSSALRIFAHSSGAIFPTRPRSPCVRSTTCRRQFFFRLSFTAVPMTALRSSGCALTK